MNPKVDRHVFCPACVAFAAVPRDSDESYKRGIDAIFDRLDRVAALHRQYRRKHR